MTTTNLSSQTDAVTRYGYERTDIGTTCTACGTTFAKADGSIMRSHARRCSVDPRDFHTPGVCNA